jgi:hypothetical protein
MQRSSRPIRTSAKLSDSLHRQLNMYALAASAAGVGLLAFAQPTESLKADEEKVDKGTPSA